MVLQNVVDWTQALHTLRSKGVSIRPADLAFLSPYGTSKSKRLGEYPTDLKSEAMPTRTTSTLPLLVSVVVVNRPGFKEAPTFEKIEP